MNKALTDLLRLTPGVVLKRGGSVRDLIPPTEWTATLRMQDPKINLEPNQWVQIRAGTYKGDVGLVTEYYDGVVNVLLVPRLK